MQLSSQLFTEIVGVSDDAGLLAPQDERRASPRANLGCRARIYPLLEASANNGQPVLVRDISVHGIGMLAGETMTSGDEFVIHLPTINSSFGSEPVQIQCSVRRCQPGGTGKTQFFVGATFELVLNRPLTYAVQMPPETSDDAGTELVPTDTWDPFAATEVENRFDAQTVESMVHRPQRASIGEQLSRYLLARLIGRLFLALCTPLLKTARKLGILRSIDLNAFKIRSRLATPRKKKIRTLSELAHLDEQEPHSVDPAHAEPQARVQTYAERSVLTALDSASQYVQGIENTLPPVSTAPTLTGLEKRVPLFAPTGNIDPVPETIEPPVTPFVACTPEVQSPPASVTPPPLDVPAVMPAFELPELLPTPTVAAPEPLPSMPLSSPTDLLVQQLYLPPEIPSAEKKTKTGTAVAWRARSRSVLNQSPRYRPKLGR